MPRQKILITVKTYPVLSTKYQELVCTAGFLEDGSWIRIYPVPFRKMDIEHQYQKYHWITADIEKSQKDDRPESYRVVDLKTLEVQEEVPTGKDGVWEARRKLVLKNVQTSKRTIIEGAHANKFSLVVFKPKKFIKFTWEAAEEREWDPNKIAALEDDRKQLDIFEGLQDPFKVVKKIPYKFFYEFEDEAGEKSRLMIEDWEIGALYWNCFKTTNHENETCEQVKKKYWDDFVLTKDVYLFLGTTKEYHFKKAPNPYLVVGVFPPRFKVQESLF
jgi:hypothetical protein